MRIAYLKQDGLIDIRMVTLWIAGRVPMKELGQLG